MEQLARLQCPVGGVSGNTARVISWSGHVYVGGGGGFLYVFSLRDKRMTAVYVFPSNIRHLELDPSSRQLYVLCANYGICLLEWDEAGRLVMDPGSTTQHGNVTVHHIGPSFACVLDPSVCSFTLASDVLVLAVQQPRKWQFKLFHRKSLRYEDSVALPYREVKTSPTTDTGNSQPVLCCVSLYKESNVNGAPSNFLLEAPLFNRMFGVDAALLQSSVIVCGFPDGRVDYFPIKSSGSSCGNDGSHQSRAKILYHLQQPVVSIGAAKMRARNEQPIGSSEDVPCDCMLFFGQKGSLVTVTSGDEKEGAACAFRDDRLQAPVCCTSYSSSGVFYGTPSDLYCVTVSRAKDEATTSATGYSVLSSVRHNIPMVSAVTQNIHSTDGTELVLLSSRGRLMLYKFNQKESQDRHPGPGSSDTGQRIKELLSGIGSVSDRVSRLKPAVDKRKQSLLKLNRVMTLSRQLLLPRQCKACPILCDMRVSWAHMLQKDHMAVSCSLENRTECILERGWTLCVLIGSDPSTSYSFPLEPLKPGERTEVRFPLWPLRCHTLNFPIKITSELFYSLKTLVADGASSTDTSVCSIAQRGISIPVQEHHIDLLQCLRLGPHSSPPFDWPEDVVGVFIKAMSKGEVCSGYSGSLPDNTELLKAVVCVAAAILALALRTEKSGKSLCLAVLQWLLSRDLKDQSLIEVQGLTPDGHDFILRLQEISVSDLAAGGNLPAIEVQILSSHLSVVASIHSAVISRLQLLLQKNEAQNGCHTPDLDLGKIQQRFTAYSSLLREVKSLRERLCLDEDVISSAASRRLLQIYKELRDPGLLLI